MSDTTDPLVSSPDHSGLVLVGQELTREVNALRVEVRRIPALETRTAVIGIVTAVVVVLAVGFGFLAWQANAAATDAAVRAECQARVNDALITALDERSESARVARQRDRDALDALLTQILNPAATATDRRDAIVTFKQGLVATEQARSTTPYPTIRC